MSVEVFSGELIEDGVEVSALPRLKDLIKRFNLPLLPALTIDKSTDVDDRVATCKDGRFDNSGGSDLVLAS